MSFDAPRPESATLWWTYFLQEAAQQGVLFRRGGCNFIAYTHTEADIDRAVSVAVDILSTPRRHSDAGSLPGAVRAGLVEPGLGGR